MTRIFRVGALFVVVFNIVWLVSCGNADESPSPEPQDSDVCASFEVYTTGGTRVTTRQQLEELHASGCTRVESVLRIRYIPGVEDLRLLENLRYAPFIIISQTQDLRSLKGLENLTEYSNLYLIQNDALTDLSGLATPEPGPLEQLYVQHNDRLTELEGLPAFDEITTRIIIDSNKNLESLGPVHRESIFTGRFLAVRNNPKLSQCRAESFAEVATIDHPWPDSVEYFIEGNGPCEGE